MTILIKNQLTSMVGMPQQASNVQNRVVESKWLQRFFFKNNTITLLVGCLFPSNQMHQKIQRYKLQTKTRFIS